MEVYSEVGLTDTKSVTVSPSFLQIFDNYLAAAMLLTNVFIEIKTGLFVRTSKTFTLNTHTSATFYSIHLVTHIKYQCVF